MCFYFIQILSSICQCLIISLQISFSNCLFEYVLLVFFVQFIFTILIINLVTVNTNVDLIPCFEALLILKRQCGAFVTAVVQKMELTFGVQFVIDSSSHALDQVEDRDAVCAGDGDSGAVCHHFEARSRRRHRRRRLPQLAPPELGGRSVKHSRGRRRLA
jgi:hypothetical protein